MIGYRIEPDMLPDEVMKAAVNLHAALIEHTDYTGLQVTYNNVLDITSSPTFDVQVEETD